jgi:transposase
MSGIRLTPDDVDFIMKMELGVTEGTIRYRIKRKLSGKEDGRKQKPSELDRYYEVIKQWEEQYRGVSHRPAMKTLYERLQRDYRYKGSYDAFRRYIRKHLAEFHGKVMRIETSPGDLLLVDWKEDIQVQMGRYGNWVKLQGLCFTPGFSRKMAVQFCERKDLESFIQCHQRGFREIGGFPEVVRTDCLKRAVIRSGSVVCEHGGGNIDLP